MKISEAVEKIDSFLKIWNLHEEHFDNPFDGFRR